MDLCLNYLLKVSCSGYYRGCYLNAKYLDQLLGSFENNNFNNNFKSSVLLNEEDVDRNNKGKGNSVSFSEHLKSSHNVENVSSTNKYLCKMFALLCVECKFIVQFSDG